MLVLMPCKNCPLRILRMHNYFDGTYYFLYKTLRTFVKIGRTLSVGDIYLTITTYLPDLTYVREPEHVLLITFHSYHTPNHGNCFPTGMPLLQNKLLMRLGS